MEHAGQLPPQKRTRFKMFSIEMSGTQTLGAILNSMIWSTHLVFHSHLCINNFGAILIPQLFTIIDSRNVCFRRRARLGFTKSHQLGDPKNVRFSQRYMLCQHVGRLIVLLPFLRCWRALLTYKAFPSLVWGSSTLTKPMKNALVFEMPKED